MNYRHGGRKSKLYAVWNGIMGRCLNQNNPAYPRYGGRGITICDRWRDFAAFLADMGEPPPGFSVERVDNDQGYSPTNCIWADRKTQGRNKRDNHLLTVNGETLTIAEWADRVGLKYATVHQRIRYGWPPDAAVLTPLVTVRRGIKRGQRAFGARHGVRFQDEEKAA